MTMCDTLKTFLQRCRAKMICTEDNDLPESYIPASSDDNQTRIQDIEREERIHLAALVQHVERLCASQKAHNDAVLERLGLSLQQDNFLQPHPPASLTKRPESSVKGGRRLRPLVEEQNFIFASEEAKLTAKYRSQEHDCPDTHTTAELTPKIRDLTPSPPPLPPPQAPTRRRRIPVMAAKLEGSGKEVADGYTLQSAKNKMEDMVKNLEKIQEHNCPDTHTTAELTPKIRDFTPSPPTLPPPQAPTRTRRIPVMAAKLEGSGKEVADGYTLQSAKNKMEDMVKNLEKIQQIHHASRQPSGPPSTAAPPDRKGLRCRTQDVAPKVPTPPTKPAQANRKGPRHGRNLRPQRSVTHQVDRQPLLNPTETLSLCFKQLASEDWEKKMDGLKSVQVLAQHHPELLQTKLHEVCLVLAEEVNNLRSSVAVSAMETVKELHVQLGKAMDPEAERTGRALLLKLAATTNAFIHQQANLALDALVNGCSPGRISSVLINTGLNHRCVAVRASTAQHLYQLVEIIGVNQVLTGGKTFAERFLFAVSKLAVDAAPDVRQHGQAMLQGLAQQKEFRPMWDKVVPVKDRPTLQKILQKMRK